jgi:Protein of unknown function (DUF3987)
MPGADEFDVNPEDWRKQFWSDDVNARADAKADGKADDATPKPEKKPNGADHWDEPDMDILRMRRRPPPVLPLEVFGAAWKQWIIDTAEASACPVDYVVAPLLASASTLIGNARWAQAWPGWVEPPHLWLVAVGDSGDGKSPGADSMMRDVLPPIERQMVGDYADRLREWQSAVEFDKIAKKRWVDDLREAQEKKKPLPTMPVPVAAAYAPEKPRLRQHDTTIEQVGAILATAAPKGVVMVRDEIAGWLMGMDSYNPAARPFWIEAYGGRPYRVERRKHGGEPIEIDRLVVSVYGGTQPERLADLSAGVDDGLFSRILWAWPNAIPFQRGSVAPGTAWAIEALNRLRELDLAPGDPPSPILMQLAPGAQAQMVEFAKMMAESLGRSGGLLRSAHGKARGAALRLSLVLEWLWCCGKSDMSMPPDCISEEAFSAAAWLVESYFMPMAQRVVGDANASPTEITAATLARWIKEEGPREVHVRAMIREVRLPGLRSAEQIKAAAKVLVDADWLREPAKTVFRQPRSRVAYAVNPLLWRGA